MKKHVPDAIDSIRQAGALSEDETVLEALGSGAEFRVENPDDLSRRVTRLNERAHDWSTGKAGWFAKDYINGEICIILNFRLFAKDDATTGYIALAHYNLSAIFESQVEVVNFGSVDGGRYQAMLVDVVCVVDAPKHVSKRCPSIAFIKRSDIIHDDVFEAIILPAEFVQRASPLGLLAILIRAGGLETWRDLIGFICEWEDDVVVGNASGSGQSGDKVVDRVSDVVDAIAHNQRNNGGNGDLSREKSLSLGQLTYEPLGVRAVLNHKSLPVGARLVGVYAGPIEL